MHPILRFLSSAVVTPWLAISLAACAATPAPKLGSPADVAPAPAADGEPRAPGDLSDAPEAPGKDYEPVSLDGFKDSIHHYENATGKEGYSRYRPERIVEIANNILLHQRDNGGWHQNFDPTRILSKHDAKAIRQEHKQLDASFDNHSTYTHVEYLAQVYERTHDVRFRAAAVHGLDYVLRAQDPSGGWPHSYPGSVRYHPHITFLDDVMIGVLSMVRKAAVGRAPFVFLDAPTRARCQQAWRFGEETLLRLQVQVDGKLTVWAGQYDRKTLVPTTGRAYELPSLVSGESVAVVRYLMSIEQPSPEIRRAIEGAIEWFRRSAIHGLRIDTLKTKKKRYVNLTSHFDRVEVKDPKAPPIWARFYDIPTNRPFLANRDGKKVYRLAQLPRERRSGYAWYGSSPARLLETDYPRWKMKWPDPAPTSPARAATPTSFLNLN